VFVPFDNVLDTDEVLQVNEDQLEMGRIMGRWLTKNVGTSGKILEVRGLQGNSVDRDRHLGFREIMEASGNSFKIIEVIGNWDDGTAQKVVADAVAVHGQFAGMFVQGGSTGAVRALMDAGHPFIPVAGEAENGFRKLCAEHASEGLVCSSAGQSPGLVAIAAKTAITALQGEIVPQYVSVPIPLVENPDFEAGVNYYPELGDNFFTPNEFPPCNVNITATEIMAKSESDQ
jgi:ribose transport system substrate-binding protein